MGHVSMFNMGHHELYTTMGIYIGQEYRGNGYGKEAIQLVIDYLFNTQRYESIQLQVFGYNKKAYDRLEMKVPKGEKESIVAHAEKTDGTLNKFLNRAVREAMERDNKETE